MECGLDVRDGAMKLMLSRSAFDFWFELVA